MSQNDKAASNRTFPWKEVLTFLGVVIAAYLSYLGVRSTIEIPIQATQTAEARQTAGAQLYGLTPSDADDADVTPTVETSTAPQSTETPSNYADPKIFIQEYFVLLNQGRYEEAWSQLSNEFQANSGPGGYEEYVAFWETVDEIEIIKMEITSQTEAEAFVYVEVIYHYQEGYTTTGHTNYKLIKDALNESWLFAPN